MSHRHPPTDRLVKRAIPILEALAAETEQSCHLAVLHDDMALILATGHNPRPMAYIVKTGALFPLFQTSSGSVIFAFLPPDRQAEILARAPAEELADIRERVAEVRHIGYERHVSLAVGGIPHLCCPIFAPSGVFGPLPLP